MIQDLFSTLTKLELMERLEGCGLPFAGIGTPGDLFDEPHLLASGGLIDVTMEDGKSTLIPSFPMAGTATEGLPLKVPGAND